MLSYSGRKITKKEAIRGCMSLYLWLAKNPAKGKHDWPGWKRIRRFYASEANYCYACAYAFQDHNNGCKSCFLHKAWFNGKIPSDITFGAYSCACIDKRYNGWYLKYDRAKTKKTRVKYAMKIADECKRLLEEGE